MEIKPAEKPAAWSLMKNIADSFKQKTISTQDFNEKLSQPIRLSLTKQQSFELIKDMRKHGILDFQPNRGRILFKE